MNLRLVAVLVLGLAVRLLFITGHGFKYDIDAYSNWATLLATHGPLAIYGPLPQPPVDYPPGYLYVLWATGIAHSLVGGGAIGMRVLLKIVPILADLVVIWFSYRAARRLATERAALILAAVVALAPPLWLDSAYWGQSDSVPIALLFATIFALADGSVLPGLPLLAIAIATKPQGIAIAPALLVACERSWEAVRSTVFALIASLGICYAVTLPFTTARDPLSVYAFLFGTYANGIAIAPYTTNGAFNLYTLVSTYHENDAALFLGIPYRILGVALVSVTIVFIAATLGRSLLVDQEKRRRLARILGAASLSLLTLFLFATRVHERYLLPALALAAPLAVEDRPTAIALTWLVLTFTLNCAYSFKGLYTPGHPHTIELLARACALGNIVAFAVLAQRQLRRPARPTKETTP